MQLLPARRKYHHLNKILIDSDVLCENHAALQRFHPEAKIAPVLKSNAYGHGIEVVAPIFDELHAPFLIVDSLFEAYELYKLNVKTPILIMGYTHPENFSVKQLPFHFSVFDLEVAKKLNQYQRNCNVHIFVDTGMCREGVQLSLLSEFVMELLQLENLHIVGLASHFADADNVNSDTFTKRQIHNYKKALKILENLGIHPIYRHISSSGGAFKITDPTFTMIRAGLASYGIHPLEAVDSALNTVNLRPALSFYSTLSQIKKVEKGDRIGYNGTFTVRKATRIGLLPLGYYEGVDRRLSNCGTVTIKGKDCPILGRVSMNMTTVDLSSISNPEVGDDVVIYSDNLADKNSLTNAAATAGTIPYELLVHLAESVKREIKR